MKKDANRSISIVMHKTQAKWIKDLNKNKTKQNKQKQTNKQKNHTEPLRKESGKHKRLLFK